MSDDETMDWESHTQEIQETAEYSHQTWETTQEEALARGYSEQDNADSNAAFELAADVNESAQEITENW